MPGGNGGNGEPGNRRKRRRVWTRRRRVAKSQSMQRRKRLGGKGKGIGNSGQRTGKHGAGGRSRASLFEFFAREILDNHVTQILSAKGVAGFRQGFPT